MERADGRVPELHHVEHGRGVPLLVLHGAGVDHREPEAALEPLLAGRACRRIYPDLPGMGRSGADGLDSNEAVVDLLAEFLETVAGEPALVIGHSYGAYLARGLAARRPDLVRGLGLLCPIADGCGRLPAHGIVQQDPGAHAELDPDERSGYDDYFVVRTPATARRYRDAVLPGKHAVDEEALGRVFAAWEVDVGSAPSTLPTLILAGRRDSIAGYEHAEHLLTRYPDATLVVLEGAGHALMHERPDRVGRVVREWIDRSTTQ